jgi:hypothetical protein
MFGANALGFPKDEPASTFMMDATARMRLAKSKAVLSTLFMAASGWLLKPGDKIKRTDLHRQYGGRTQGGIGPSRLTLNVFIFSDPPTGKKYGYFDEWKSDGCYHYTGEGQHGAKK